MTLLQWFHEWILIGAAALVLCAGWALFLRLCWLYSQWTPPGAWVLFVQGGTLILSAALATLWPCVVWENYRLMVVPAMYFLGGVGFFGYGWLLRAALQEGGAP